MNEVLTPDGWGQVLRTQSAHGRTSYLVKGAGFEGWYDGLQVTADFADQPDDVVPNEDNETALPYPSRPQGPGWDGTTSTIPPDVDPHLEMGGTSDSLTGDPTSEDPVDADIEGLFEPSSRLAGVRPRRVHFAASDDTVLNVSALPEESPIGLENSPINPDSVSTDDLFRESSATYDRLVIEDDLSFLKFASDEDEQDEDDDSDDDSGDDDDSDDDDSDSEDDDDSDSSDDDSDDDDDNSRTAAAFALTTTSDLHFLANFCKCAENLPLHSKSEHRELVSEGKLKDRRKKGKPLGSKPLTGKHGDRDPKTPSEAGYVKTKGVAEAIKPTTRKNKKRKVAEVDGVNPQSRDMNELEERYRQDQLFHPAPLDLVDHSEDDGDSADLYNKYAGYDPTPAWKLKTAAPAADPGPTQIESQIEQLMQFWAVDNNGWWHWTGSQADLALLNQMQQQMMAVGMPGGPPGQMQAQSAVEGFQVEASTPAPWREYLQTIASDKLVALAAWRDVVEKSKRLRSEGAVDVEVFKPEVITAYIQGDHGRYYTTVQRLGSVAPGVGRQLTSTQVSGWSCECEWGHWAWIRKRSFVGRMCSHAYALFSEMRSLDARARRNKGKPIGGGQSLASARNKSSWTRTSQGGFEWVTDDLTMPTAAITKSAAGWDAQVWSDGTAEDSLSLGTFKNSQYALYAAARTIKAHVKLADDGDVDLVGGEEDPYSQDGASESEVSEDGDQEGTPGVQESTTRTGSLSVFAESDDGQDDEGSEENEDGIEEEEDPEDEESLDEEIAEDEDDSDDGAEDEGDGGHDEPHRRDDDDEGTDNPGDESDDDGIEKESSVAELQNQYGLTHLAGANYSLAEQDKLVREGEGKTARNRGDLNLAGTHYEAQIKSGSTDAEDVLAFLF